jgi:hypothetical protein
VSAESRGVLACLLAIDEKGSLGVEWLDGWAGWLAGRLANDRLASVVVLVLESSINRIVHAHTRTTHAITGLFKQHGLVFFEGSWQGQKHKCFVSEAELPMISGGWVRAFRS